MVKKTDKKPPQIASIEQPFGCDMPTVHCPICGKAPLILSEEDGATLEPCAHVAFIYIGAYGDFEYRSKDFDKRAQEAKQEFENSLELEALQTLGYDNKLLVLEITYGGMACGPVWYTDAYGFDYGE